MHGRLGGTCHKLHCKKITAYVSISQETRAASIGRNHAADAGIRAQIDRKEEIVRGSRSEEHTSELQSLMRISYAVFCLKKKKNNKQKNLYKRVATNMMNKIKKTYINKIQLTRNKIHIK